MALNICLNNHGVAFIIYSWFSCDCGLSHNVEALLLFTFNPKRCLRSVNQLMYFMGPTMAVPAWLKAVSQAFSRTPANIKWTEFPLDLVEIKLIPRYGCTVLLI
jgi:hypothetical protein